MLCRTVRVVNAGEQKVSVCDRSDFRKTCNKGAVNEIHGIDTLHIYIDETFVENCIRQKPSKTV